MIIGLTGASGSGKSIAAAFFREKGFFIMDFDKISREISENGSPCLKELTEIFGDDIIDSEGNLKRKALGDIVFKNPDKLKILNEITHKYILKKANILKNQNSGKNIIYDAPLLFEAGLHRECDIVLSIITDLETRIERITKRDGISRDTAMGRIKSQKENKYYIENSDFYIENSSTPDELYKKLEKLLKELNIHGDCS
ncbi:MAG: dephospho-CoA kinase [Clostridia bacterium]|nr:dephospho-CoA kinase [Clostridia bacterium]